MSGACVVLDHVSFARDDGEGGATPVLEDVSAIVEGGALHLLVGATGSGKSTLLGLLTPRPRPSGVLGGTVRVWGRVPALAGALSPGQVAIVGQDPWAQLVSERVMEELTLGPVALGLDHSEVMRRVAEVSYLLGLGPLLHRRCQELSGGQAQLVALGAVLAMAPSLLLLDEPTAALDPVASRDLAAVLGRINRELGLSMVVATHDIAALAPVASSASLLGEGRLRAVAPDSLADPLSADPLDIPGTNHPAPPADAIAPTPEAALVLAGVWARHGQGSPWVLKGLDGRFAAGTLTCLMGSNGCGKSTLLEVMAAMVRPRRGRVTNPWAREVGYLPQDPRELLVAETVTDDLGAWMDPRECGPGEVARVMGALGITHLAGRDPQGLSGGERRLVALAKVCLARPRLLLLDEPTQGLDGQGRRRVATLLRQRADEGTCVIVCTHDGALARAVADEVALLFDGRLVDRGAPQGFFSRGLHVLG